MPQPPESFKTTVSLNYSTGVQHWSPSLPNPFANQVEELYKNFPARRAQIQQQFDFGRPVAAPAFCRLQDTTKEVGNWTPLALNSGHVIQQQRHDAIASSARTVSSWPVSTIAAESEATGSGVAPGSQPEPAAVPFIDFLGVGAA